jgi:hypothetical protein
MAQTYLLFDFGADEGKVQQARHKLDSWRQAFRLDKKLQFKVDRGEVAPAPAGAAPEEKAKGSLAPAERTKSKPKAQAKSKTAESTGDKNGNVKLFVRLYFSAHEKLSEQRWVTRIPAEEPFKGAAPRVVQEGSPEFAAVLKQFDSLD